MRKRREMYLSQNKTKQTKTHAILALCSNMLGVDNPLSILLKGTWPSWASYRTEHTCNINKKKEKKQKEVW